MLKLVQVKHCIDEYLENISKSKSISSQRQEKVYFKDLQEYLDEKNITEIDKVEPKDLDFFQGRLSRAKEHSTVNRQFTLYNHFFSKCVEWGYIQLSPSRFIKKKKELEPIRKLWSKEEIEIVLKNSNGWLHDTVLFMSNTGCRAIELVQIAKEDVDHIDRAVRLYSDKNSGGHRLIPLNEVSYNILNKRCANVVEEKDLLFKTEIKTPLRTDHINKTLKRLQRKLGISRKPIYSLRHTYATNLCLSGVGIEIIRMLLGHKKLQTTQKYMRVEFFHLKQVVNRAS